MKVNPYYERTYGEGRTARNPLLHNDFRHSQFYSVSACQSSIDSLYLECKVRLPLRGDDMKIFQVGGSVRDKLLGVKSKDIDYAVECDSFLEMRQHIASIGTIFLEKPEFLTIRAKVNGEFADYVMCRKDGHYSDNRRPDSVTPGTIMDDLARRDFTMNAIAIDTETGTYLDPFNGIGDIASMTIRCVGSNDRLIEDPLRLLRLIRFVIKLNFHIERELSDFIFDTEWKDLLASVSVERQREELTKCMAMNTLQTLRLLSWFELDRCLFNGPLWLKPTLEGR